jgi:hypothetical protein
VHSPEFWCLLASTMHCLLPISDYDAAAESVRTIGPEDDTGLSAIRELWSSR